LFQLMWVQTNFLTYRKTRIFFTMFYGVKIE